MSSPPRHSNPQCLSFDVPHEETLGAVSLQRAQCRKFARAYASVIRNAEEKVMEPMRNSRHDINMGGKGRTQQTVPEQTIE